MHIQSFHMDGFGIFSDVTVEGLAPGLSIFLGENEAGKSTCLEFLRTTLAGYPAPNSREGKLIPGPLRGGNAGGSLTLHTQEEGILRLTRRPGGSGGHVSLADGQGKPLDEDVLRRLLSGVSRDVYRNVFGFSLTELENMGNLTGESVRHALYGASFGPGLRSPGEALAILKKQTDEIFKSGGSKPPLNQALRQLNDLRQRMAELRQQQAGFDALAGELGEKKEDLAAVRGHKSRLEEERRLLERRLSVWLQWNEWRMVCAALERLGPINPSFPEDGQARLARAQEARESCERHLAALTEKLNLLRERRNAIQPDEALLEALPPLRRMAERKSGFRRALAAL
ncbi:AAA family ATPase, partial [Desulfovibrio sp. 1188_IL3213]|uniref:AAA family ATPase n=2 Tax=unclassified Desulfovibrio TaxID=2593640 RepID=UPI002FDB934C